MKSYLKLELYTISKILVLEFGNYEDYTIWKISLFS